MTRHFAIVSPTYLFIAKSGTMVPTTVSDARGRRRASLDFADRPAGVGAVQVSRPSAAVNDGRLATGTGRDSLGRHDGHSTSVRVWRKSSMS